MMVVVLTVEKREADVLSVGPSYQSEHCAFRDICNLIG